MNKTLIWWRALCIVSIVNIIVWAWVFWLQSNIHNISYLQPALSGIYVAVCAFRSFFPRIDLERYCLHDTPLSSIVLGRSAATLAEICFSIQCALIIYNLGLLIDSDWVTMVAYSVVPIVVIAQFFCWYATLTLNHFWHGMEESAWVVMIALAASCFVMGYQALDGGYQLLMVVGLISCIGSLYIMLCVDIPMYFSRKKHGIHSGNEYLNISQGLSDAIQRRVHTHDWLIWKKEVLWITSYFTVGVWLSISMMLINFSV